MEYVDADPFLNAAPNRYSSTVSVSLINTSTKKLQSGFDS